MSGEQIIKYIKHSNNNKSSKWTEESVNVHVLAHFLSRSVTRLVYNFPNKNNRLRVYLPFVL